MSPSPTRDGLAPDRHCAALVATVFKPDIKSCERTTCFFSQARFYFFLESNFQIGAGVHELGTYHHSRKVPFISEAPHKSHGAKYIESQ
jgi:hypothetical protein